MAGSNNPIAIERMVVTHASGVDSRNAPHRAKGRCLGFRSQFGQTGLADRVFKFEALASNHRPIRPAYLERRAAFSATRTFTIRVTSSSGRGWSGVN